MPACAGGPRGSCEVCPVWWQAGRQWGLWLHGQGAQNWIAHAHPIIVEWFCTQLKIPLHSGLEPWERRVPSHPFWSHQQSLQPSGKLSFVAGNLKTVLWVMQLFDWSIFLSVSSWCTIVPVLRGTVVLTKLDLKSTHVSSDKLYTFALAVQTIMDLKSAHVPEREIKHICTCGTDYTGS